MDTEHQTLTTKLFGTIRQIVKVMRLRPFDTSTPEGRAAERHRRIALTAGASVAAKGVGLLTMLIAIPLTASYLGNERFGLWLTISSIVTMLSFADLGIGNGLLSAIADANGRGDRAAARRYVSSAACLLLASGVVLMAAFAVAYPWIPWAAVYNLKSYQGVAEAGPVTLVLVLCFALSMPLGVVQRVQAGYQEGFGSSLWVCLGSVLSLGAIILAVRLKAGLPGLVLAMNGAPVLATLANWIVQFGWQRPWLRPSPDAVDRVAVRRVLRTGLLFLTLQLAIAIGYQSDNIVIAQVLGEDQVPQYAVPARLFTISPMLLGFLLAPLWPAYGEAIARADVAWVKRTLRRSLLIGALVNVPPSLILMAFGAPIVRMWVGEQAHITPSLVLLLGLGCWSMLNSLAGPFAVLLNGANVVRFQVVCSVLMAATNLPISIYLAHKIGVSGVVWGTVLAQAAFVFLPISLYVPRLLRRMQEQSQPAPPAPSAPPALTDLNGLAGAALDPQAPTP